MRNLHLITPSFSTAGNLVKLIPSLYGNTQSLDSLLPMLSDLTYSITDPQSTSVTPHQDAVNKLTLSTPPTSPATTIIEMQTSPMPLPISTAQSHKLPGRPSNKPSKPRSTSVEGTVEPVSLEMFNKAAADLEAKGMINLKEYTKYLAKKDAKVMWSFEYDGIMIDKVISTSYLLWLIPSIIPSLFSNS